MRKLLLHASCLYYRPMRKSVLITGDSGSGKSILFTLLRATEVLEDGNESFYAPFVPIADDRIYLSQSGKLLPCREDLVRPRIKEPTEPLAILAMRKGDLPAIYLLDFLFLFKKSLRLREAVAYYEALSNLVGIPTFEIERKGLDEMRADVISLLKVLRNSRADQQLLDCEQTFSTIYVNWRHTIIAPHVDAVVYLSEEPEVYAIEEDDGTFDTLRRDFYNAITSGSYEIDGDYIKVKVRVKDERVSELNMGKYIHT
ncbi:MAG: hypothetical protein QW711_05360 [Candidatus Korarchaeum sp.]